MKKIISFILIAVLCLGVLTSCDQVNGVIDGIKDKLGLGEQVDDAAADKAFNDAVQSLHRMYKDKAESTSVDFDLVSQVIVGGVKYPVTWTCDNDKVVIRDSVNAGFYTVDLPDVNEEEFTYTLTATITDGGERSEQKSYTFKMLVLDNSAVDTILKEGVAYKMFLVQGTYGQRMYALNTLQMGTGDGANYGKYIKTSTNPADGADYYAEIVDGGYKWYTEIDGVKYYVHAQTLFESADKKEENKYSKYIGLSTENASVFSYNAELGGVWTVLIDGNTFGVGTYSDYKTICISESTHFAPEKIGVSQFVVQFMTSEYASTLTPDEEIKVDEPAANSTLTIKEALELGVAVPTYTTNKYYVTGEITNIYDAQYGNMYIKDAEGNELCIYGTYDATGANRFDAMTKQPAVGDTITVYGVIGKYNGKAQMKDGWITSINGEGETPNPPSDKTYSVVTELKTGDHVLIGNPSNGKLLSATKTGFYNNGIDYSESNFANVTDAEIWVVTVNDDGSYSFTSLTGEKLGMADSYSSFNSEGPNFGWTIEAKEGDTGIFYIKNTVRGNYIEWYADKGNWSSYATSSLSALFELSFYVEGEGNTDTPVDPDPEEPVDPNPETPVVPEDGIYTIPQVLAAAEGTQVIVKGTVVEIYQAWNPQFNNVSFYIADAEGNRLLVFRTGTNANIGDQVTVTGTATLYNSVIQIAQGGTTVIDVAHVCSEFTAADCLNAPKCTVCGKENGEALGHKYENGVCGTCGAAEVTGTTTASKNVADLITELGWTGSTTKQSFTLDDNVTVKVDGGSNSGKAYDGDHIRIYATDSPAGTLTISVAEGYELVSVKVTTATGTYAFLCVDGSDADISNETVAVSGSSVVLNSVKNGSNGKQVRVMAIEVVYKSAN